MGKVDPNVRDRWKFEARAYPGEFEFDHIGEVQHFKFRYMFINPDIELYSHGKDGPIRGNELDCAKEIYWFDNLGLNFPTNVEKTTRASIIQYTEPQIGESIWVG
ncbi:hypothetical protein ID866_2070 [Astraeus odoratus]|nr:hypothetical protein ID866_2070 [Astraeus odoratus]